jgi:hypothetical protein
MNFISNRRQRIHFFERTYIVDSLIGLRLVYLFWVVYCVLFPRKV